jgi:hypothetical protein
MDFTSWCERVAVILVEETKTRFGYDPAMLSKGCHSKVLRKCDDCGEVKEVQLRQAGEVCSPCHMRRVAASLANTPEEAAASRERQLQKSREKSKIRAAQRIMAPCIKCGVVSLRPVLSYKTHPCVTCSQSESWAKRIAENKAKGLSARGIPFEELEERDRKGQAKWYRKMYKRPLGRCIQLMRSTFSAMLRKGYKSSKLPYSPLELRQHIEAELQACHHRCPMCLADLELVGYQVDHIVPLDSAKSEEEIAQLFALTNLSVLCPDCNTRVKRERPIDYKSSRRMVNASSEHN